jgi:hypothetical protein
MGTHTFSHPPIRRVWTSEPGEKVCVPFLTIDAAHKFADAQHAMCVV